MGERSGAAHAVTEGLARAASAPTVLAGTIAATLLLSLPPSPHLRGLAGAHLDTVVMSWLGGLGQEPLALRTYAAAIDVRSLALLVVFWSFVSGGILDRYARNRATRGRGFFGACGAHFPSMLRLAVIVLLLDWALYALVARRAMGSAVLMGVSLALFVAVGVIARYARIRLVVEDRRSAVGALLAGLRFVRRNPAGAGVSMIYAALIAAAAWFYGVVAPPGQPGAPWRALVTAEGFILVQSFLVLASHGAGIALFQARLAHASYTAAPPLEWPDSPAAEAVTNLSPSAIP